MQAQIVLFFKLANFKPTWCWLEGLIKLFFHKLLTILENNMAVLIAFNITLNFCTFNVYFGVVFSCLGTYISKEITFDLGNCSNTCFRKGKNGLLSNTQKWIVRGDTCADKARDFTRKGCVGGEQQVRGPRRTALPCGSQPQVSW